MEPSLSLTKPRPAGGRGWGLRCARDLRQGEFVCEYAGEVITTTEAVRSFQPKVQREAPGQLEK